MPKYLIKARYSSEGIRGVLSSGGSARRSAAEEVVKSAGGSIESMHFAFGEDDAYLLCDLPDNHAAAKVAMTVSASGRVSITTVPLLTVDEMDAIAAGDSLSYTAPGK